MRIIVGGKSFKTNLRNDDPGLLLLRLGHPPQQQRSRSKADAKQVPCPARLAYTLLCTLSCSAALGGAADGRSTRSNLDLERAASRPPLCPPSRGSGQARQAAKAKTRRKYLRVSRYIDHLLTTPSQLPVSVSVTHFPGALGSDVSMVQAHFQSPEPAGPPRRIEDFRREFKVDGEFRNNHLDDSKSITVDVTSLGLSGLRCYHSVGTFASDQVLAFVHFAMPFDLVADFDGAHKGSTPLQSNRLPERRGAPGKHSTPRRVKSQDSRPKKLKSWDKEHGAQSAEARSKLKAGAVDPSVPSRWPTV
ncbi:uncharacterized protein CLUP02_16623 [Colletotrichum lupini]|uniref:Uncharacterized protein n=1 Tax=Colletotrichum lupini TaxID=145971 RepID=A0A9Q8WPQ0_9PEZI|nr:uncharacterized protein CLUP02_16623 [Colletotrichum lupini]UQC91089.1 hypothetical protein CLUP02_16623 [Colletotrichum lupini]